MPKRKKSSKRSSRKDLTASEVNELEELKDELTDYLDTSSSSNLSATDSSGDRVVFPIVSHSSHQLVKSRVLSVSAPSSPTRDRSTSASCSSRLSVKNLVARFESRLCESVFVNMALRAELDPITKSRAGYKSHVTRKLNHLISLNTAKTLDINLFKRLEQSINSHIQEVERKDIEISAVYDKHAVAADNADRKADSDSNADFILDAYQKLARLETAVTSSSVSADDNADASASPSLDDVLAAVSNKAVSKVNLDCKVFDSDKATKFEFRDWYAQFKAVMSSWPNCEAKLKLAYLKSKVEGTAKLYIVNLEQTNDNYQIIK